ncbi:hypothetical protein FACS1894169_01150 [Bacteroidia bacterium]|nr:hypothetical protein FACS1894169_01150 [Bacteroidia bacterium]
MNKSYFNIGFSHWVLLALPEALRYPVILIFVRSLVYPLSVIHRSVTNYVNQLNTSVNSQVCYMEKILNDAYDYYERRIVIRDAPISYNDFFLFDELSDMAVLVSDTEAVLWVDDDKLGSTVPDFEVVFPSGYAFTENEERAIRKMINDNKLASKKYKIVYG